MTDDKPDNNADEAPHTGESAADTPASDATGPHKKSRWPLFIILLLLLVIGAGGGLGYWQWDRWQMEQAKASEAQQSARQRTAALQQQLDQVREQLDNSSRKLSQQSRQLEQHDSIAIELAEENQRLRQQLAGLDNRLRSLSSTTNEDWKLAEAHYLTRLASQRLVMERNPQGALALLETADSIVDEFADPGLYPVREQLKADITRLKLAKPVDREGLYLSLAAIKDALVLLPSPAPTQFERSSPGPVPDNTATADEGVEAGLWQRIKNSFAGAMNRLQGYVRVTRRDQPLEPLLPPDGGAWLLTSLNLQIETAQLALMREQQPVFEQSLGDAEAILTRYYPLSSEAKSLAEQLQSLKQMPIVQQLPDIGESQRRLSRYLEDLHRVKPQAALQESANADTADDVPAEEPAETEGEPSP